jgi:hypothetical protein
MKMPVDKHHYINYHKFDDNGSVFIIELNSKGRFAKYQYDGVGCGQGSVKGFLNNHFHSDFNWFSSEHWYNKVTRWGENYPKEIVLSCPETDAINARWADGIDVSEEEFDKLCKEADHKLSKYGIPTKDILQEILKETIAKTGIEWELGCEPDTYDVEWWEAKIPLKYKGKEYLLTWENCD